MSHRTSLIIILAVIVMIPLWVQVVSCKSYRQQDSELPDTRRRGSIYVSADESFKPIIDEMVKVYES
ncbi:MAG TPA: hypothetical protein VFV31_11100, partial [Chitinophagaceae bacterium]|nr:hypothetical protein [Chitinophagaceae bacterium]